MTTRGYYDNRALTPEEVQRDERLARIARVFTKIDRVLVGNKVDVVLADQGPAPAWSDGRTITLNKDEIDDLDIAAMVQVHGLNYHEVCHVLYTPRFGSDLTNWVIDQRLMAAYNMLEDQRIETLLVGRHPSVAPYLSAVILRWLGNTQDKIQSNYILVRGRRYLDVKVRQAFRDAFSAPELIPAIESIVDEYRLLVFPRDAAAAKVLIRRFQTEVLDKMPAPPNAPCGGGGKTQSGQPQSEKSQQQDSESAKAQPSESEKSEPQAPSKGQEEASEDKGEDSEDGEGAGSGEDESSDEDGESGEGSGSGSESDADEAEGQSDKGGSKGTGKSQSQGTPTEEQAKGDGGSSAGAGDGSHADPIKAAKDAIADALDNVNNSAEVQADMTARRRAIQNGSNDGWYESTIDKGRFYGSKASGALVNTEAKFRQVLRRLAEDCDPSWERETSSGRLNVRRAMAGADPSEAFDRWAEGNEGADLEVFIGVDNSGSMNRYTRGGDGVTLNEAASETLWVLTKSLKAMGADVTACTFGSGQQVVYSREDEKVKEVLQTGASGGTDALPLLEEAERLFRSSRRRNRLLIMVTDGQWSQDKACDETMRRIEALGVLSAVAFLDPSHLNTEVAFRNYGHGAQVFGATDSGTALTAWGKSLVTATIKRFGPAVR